MTMPKGFKPKVNKKEKGEKSKNVTAKEDNNNIDSNAIKVTAATADDFSNKQENKIITDNDHNNNDNNIRIKVINFFRIAADKFMFLNIHWQLK